MSLVLYRKYRPKLFSEIIGQEHVVQTLTNGLASGLTSHAYLFAGPRGSGKTTIARLLAKSLNCQNRKDGQFEPCNECISCKEIMTGSAVDLMEIDAASHRGIDDIRELREGIKFVPARLKYKVFILDESHQLTKEASNALLKTLEEPPNHAIFIMATTEIHKMIPTIISRCQRFDFRKLTMAEIVKRLETIALSEKVKIDKPALELVAANSGGSVRDAESIFDQILTFGGLMAKDKEIKAEDVKNLLGLVETGLVMQFCDFLSQKQASSAIQFLNESAEKGLDLPEFTKALVNYLRQVLIFKITGPEAGRQIITSFTKDELERLAKQSALFEVKKLQEILGFFLEAENHMKYSSIPQLPLELAIIESCGLA